MDLEFTLLAIVCMALIFFVNGDSPKERELKARQNCIITAVKNKIDTPDIAKICIPEVKEGVEVPIK